MASRLPDELWESIGKRVNTKTNVSRFRAVCKSWRSSLPLFAKPLPLQFPIQVFTTNGYSLDCTFTESVVYHLAPPAAGNPRRGWLNCVKEGESGETHQMLYTLSQSTVPQFPFSYPKLLNLLEYRVFEVAKLYGLRLSGQRISGVDSKKCIQAFPLPRQHPNIYQDPNTNFFYQDVIFYQGKFCAVCRNGTAVEVDSSLNVTVIASPIKNDLNFKHLVESSGELLLVHEDTKPFIFYRASFSDEDSSNKALPQAPAEVVHPAHDEDSYSSYGFSDEESDSFYQELLLAPALAEVAHEGGFSSGANYQDSRILGELVLALPQVPAPAELAKPAHDEDSSYEALPHSPTPAEIVDPAHDEDSYSSSSSSSVGDTYELVTSRKFKVYKLNAAEKQWVEVEAEALRDRILVLGEEGSYSVSTGDFPGCGRGGSIYFYDQDRRR
ncbi:unnamed protein product [Prunus armeniaca]|uniref:F-box domain-containing protein n=1 Tax=Prunus armeniaca TaxID=36596 RepID=A0A6J5XWH8_PRUAR|nr:unnamed protein product [Prunus armeniaca]